MTIIKYSDRLMNHSYFYNKADYKFQMLIKNTSSEIWDTMQQLSTYIFTNIISCLQSSNCRIHTKN